MTANVVLVTLLTLAASPPVPVDRADEPGFLRLVRVENLELTGVEISLGLERADASYRFRKTDAASAASAVVEFPLLDYGATGSMKALELVKPELVLEGARVELKCLERAFVGGRDVTEDLRRHGLEPEDVLGMPEKSRSVPRGWWQTRGGKILDGDKVTVLRSEGLFSEINWLKRSDPLWRVKSKCEGEVVLGDPRDAVLKVSHRPEVDAGPLDWGDDKFFERSCLGGSARRAVRGWNPFATPLVGGVGYGFSFRGASTWGSPNASVVLVVADPRVDAVSACLGADAVRTAPNELSKHWKAADLSSGVEAYFFVRRR
jgi:hypothetical protein